MAWAHVRQTLYKLDGDIRFCISDLVQKYSVVDAYVFYKFVIEYLALYGY